MSDKPTFFSSLKRLLWTSKKADRTSFDESKHQGFFTEKNYPQVLDAIQQTAYFVLDFNQPRTPIVEFNEDEWIDFSDVYEGNLMTEAWWNIYGLVDDASFNHMFSTHVREDGEVVVEVKYYPDISGFEESVKDLYLKTKLASLGLSLEDFIKDSGAIVPNDIQNVYSIQSSKWIKDVFPSTNDTPYIYFEVVPEGSPTQLSPDYYSGVKPIPIAYKGERYYLNIGLYMEG